MAATTFRIFVVLASCTNQPRTKIEDEEQKRPTPKHRNEQQQQQQQKGENEQTTEVNSKHLNVNWRNYISKLITTNTHNSQENNEHEVLPHTHSVAQ